MFFVCMFACLHVCICYLGFLHVYNFLCFSFDRHSVATHDAADGLAAAADSERAGSLRGCRPGDHAPDCVLSLVISLSLVCLVVIICLVIICCRCCCLVLIFIGSVCLARRRRGSARQATAARRAKETRTQSSARSQKGARGGRGGRGRGTDGPTGNDISSSGGSCSSRQCTLGIVCGCVCVCIGIGRGCE